MTETPEVVQQVKIDQLLSWCRSLFQSLGITQLTGAPVEEVVAQCLRANCVQCGQSLAGDDLLRLCLPPPDAPAEAGPAMHARLLQGYCSRSGCDSFYYELRFSEHPDINWAGLIQEINQQATAPESPAEAQVPRAQRPKMGSRSKTVIYGLILVVVLLVLRYFMTGGSLPGFRKAHKFQVDPSSIATPGVR
jgi:hypothetical protein